MARIGNQNVLKIPKGCHTKTIEAYGRVITMVAVPWPSRVVGFLDAKSVAKLDADMGVIMFRSCFPPDAVIVAIMHEILHISFPSIQEKEMNAADGPFVSLCKAAGASFDGFLEGYA